MKYILILFTLSLSNESNKKEIYAFTAQSKVNEWRIVNDDVMGGISESSIACTAAGHGLFSGHVSMENNGGFASIQLNTRIQLAKEQKYIVLRIKGDGKAYEFRMKSEISQYESYVHSFATSGEWQTIKLPISEFYPQFRGRRLNSPNFNFNTIQQVSFLIANKQEEDFKLWIDRIDIE